METVPSPAPAPAVDPAAAARRKRVIRIAAAAAPIALILLALALHRSIVGAYLRHRAAGLGVDLSFDDYTLEDGSLRLNRARVELDGVEGLVVRADRVTLGRKGARITSVDASGVNIELTGSATDRVIELSQWSSEHTETYRLPGGAREVSVSWRADDEGSPWLSAEGGALRSDGKVARFSAKSASAGGVPLGRVEAGFAVDATGVQIEIGKGAGAEAPIVAKLSTGAKPPRVEVTLRPVRLEALGAALGLKLPAPRAVASGRATLALGKRKDREAITGSAELALDGYTPPQGKELGASVVGKKTAVSTAIAVAADRSKVTLSDVVVKNGKLELKGSGAITRAQKHAVAHLDLRGPVACADVVRGVAKQRLGLLGELAGDTLSGAVEGSVSVEVAVDADSRDLSAAKVKPKIGVGCGLKVP